jgi:hypothetical protein
MLYKTSNKGIIMQNGLVPIPLISDPSGSDESSEINFGKCTQCGHDLEENEFAIGDICDSCRPAFMEAWESRQEAAQEEAAERRMYPEESDDDEPYDPDDRRRQY